MILVTPDAHRSMNTFLGAAVDFAPEDVIAAQVQGAAVTYMEGYLWDSPPAKAAFLTAARLAHAAGRKIALTLSDPFLVNRYRSEEHTSELQSLMRLSYAVFCLNKKQIP